MLLVVLSLAGAIAGGSYLYLHQSVSAVQASTPEVVKAQKSLDVLPPHQAAVALVIGYDHRVGDGASPSRSDTIMLIRADPQTHTISMLSFPRDLEVPIYCGPVSSGTDRINSAYARCNAKGTLLTIKHLTGLPVNYLITVNFHGFKEVVNNLGGVWMDIDRRYYNKNVGTASTDYANINLQPGYQRLNGQQALDFVRFRHTDSDLYRNARQQQFVRAFKDQVASSLSVWKVPGIVNAITSNVEVGEGGHKLQGKEVLNYALFAYGLPHGHLFQDRIEGVTCNNSCTATASQIDQAVQQFENPDVSSSKAANASALGRKLKTKTLPPSKVSVTVLNGNGVSGAAANASYLLAQRGYRTMVPPNNLEANAPARVFHTKIYYDPAQAGSKEAAVALQQLMQPADIAKLSRDPQLLSLDPGSMLLVELGTTFDGTIQEAPVQTVPKHVAPHVVRDPAASEQLVQQYAKRVPFRLAVPTVLDANSRPDTLYGDEPSRLYYVDRHHKAVRLVYTMGTAGDFWGIEETDWEGAPVLSDKSFRHDIGGREADLYYNGSHLHMIVLHGPGHASYWVVNTLVDALSNETMLAIAKGLKPLTTGK
jgi:LCP family protein required for cell wall assembly